MRFFKTPAIAKRIYPSAYWHGRRDLNEIYLTFDDGPIPDVTDFVLDLLGEEKIKATFFCVGENVKRNPSIFSRILSEGHQAGNHTYNHLNSLKTPAKDYLQNIELCRQVFHDNGYQKEDQIFRPPYGRLTYPAYNMLKKRYRIIMWDVLSYDFSDQVETELCLSQSIKYSGPGSIIVFHDSIKSFTKLKVLLSQYISHFKKLNYQFNTIEA